MIKPERGLMVLVLIAAFGTAAQADEPGAAWYAVAFEQSFAGVDYAKSFGLNSPPSDMTSGDGARDPGNALKAALGYRRSLSSRLYLAGEIEGTFYFNSDVTGFLEGTGEGDADVWPGAWALDRRRAIGLNARLGYDPAALGFLGPERSLYLFAGSRWIDAGIEAAHVNRRLDITGSRSVDRTLNPWLAGVGMEFGKAGSRFDLRLSYAADDIGFGGGGGTVDDPIIDYVFEIREWSVSLGYVVPFGD